VARELQKQLCRSSMEQVLCHALHVK